MEAILQILLKIGFLILLYIVFMPLGKKFIEKGLDRFAETKKTSRNRVVTLQKLLVNVYFYVLLFVFLLMGFAVIGMDIRPLIAGAGVLGLAVAFGAQGLVSDIVTGFFILVEHQLEIDDYVTVGGYEGIVEEIGLRTTKIRGFDGTLNYVPNRFIEGVANHSRGNMQALVDITIPFKDNIDQAISVLDKICVEFQQDKRFTDGPRATGVECIESGSIVLRVVGQTENGKQWECERDMRKRVLEVFHKENIELPS